MYSVFTCTQRTLEDFHILCMDKAKLVGIIEGKYTYLYSYKTVGDTAVFHLDCESACFGDAGLLMEEILFPEDYENKLQEAYDNYCFKEVMFDKQVEGDVLANTTVVFVDDMYVEKDYRRHGIASEMLKAIDRVFGDCSRCICLMPFECPDGYFNVMDNQIIYEDKESYECHYAINRKIAEERGYKIADDFENSATDPMVKYAYRLSPDVEKMLKMIVKKQ